MITRVISQMETDVERQIARLQRELFEAWRQGRVGSWKVRIIQSTAACYAGEACAAYLQRALRWIEQHPEGCR
jgi:hypothetical protein